MLSRSLVSFLRTIRIKWAVPVGYFTIRESIYGVPSRLIAMGSMSLYPSAPQVGMNGY